MGIQQGPDSAGVAPEDKKFPGCVFKSCPVFNRFPRRAGETILRPVPRALLKKYHSMVIKVIRLPVNGIIFIFIRDRNNQN
jgi:hypothetical protein